MVMNKLGNLLWLIVLVFLAAGCEVIEPAGDDTPDPPVINDSLVTSRGFFVEIISEEDYIIQGSDNSGTDWTAITAINTGTDETGKVFEFVWSNFPEFPVPTDLSIRVVTASYESNPTSIDVTTAEFEYTDLNAVWYTIPVYLDNNGGSDSGIAEGWIKGSFLANTFYAVRTSYYTHINSMSGSYIRVLDEAGNLVYDSYSADPLSDDDSGDWNFSALNFKVSTTGTYYILIKPNQDIVFTEGFDPDDYGYINVDLARPVT